MAEDEEKSEGILATIWSFLSKQVVLVVVFAVLAVPLGFLLLWVSARVLPQATLWLLYTYTTMPVAALFFLLLILLGFVLLFGGQTLLGLFKSAFVKEDE